MTGERVCSWGARGARTGGHGVPPLQSLVTAATRLHGPPIFHTMRLTFETIVPIRVPAAQTRTSAEQQIQWNHQRTPTLILGDVRAFMSTTTNQETLILPQDNVSECHRSGARDHQHSMLKKQRHQTSVNLNHAINNSDLTARDPCERQKGQPEQSCGQRP